GWIPGKWLPDGPSALFADEMATGQKAANTASSRPVHPDDPPSGNRENHLRLGEPHRHTPIDLDARPIVARSRATFVRPRRVLVEPDGQVIVADWGAGTVVRISPDDKTTILLSGL